jgi:hypothetical protein
MRGEATLEGDNFSSKISVDIGKKKKERNLCCVSDVIYINHELI